MVDTRRGDAAQAIALRLHHRYLSEAALANPQIGPVFGGKLTSNPGYLLPLDWKM